MSTSPRPREARRDWGHDETGCRVLHIDMDAFYASLEVARHPELRGRPVIIGIGPRSVVSAASYEARRYGVNSAMATAQARRLCPDGVFLPVDMRYYRETSRRIFSDVLGRVTDRIEQVSVDEAYMDVSSALLAWGRPTAIARWIRAEVSARFHVTCSVGIASSAVVAKLASTMAKPDGMLLIPRSRREEFVGMMPLRAMPGIGPAMERRLHLWGISTVADLNGLDDKALTAAAGSATIARRLRLMSHGDDERVIAPRTTEKSIGAERTFQHDASGSETILGLLRWCCQDVSATLRDRHRVARTVTVKVRYPDLRYESRSHSMPSPSDLDSRVYHEAVMLLARILRVDSETLSTHSQDHPLTPLRLVGVSVSSLSDAGTTAVQPSLDETAPGEDHDLGDPSSRLRLTQAALDTVRHKYGSGAARLGF